MAGAITQALLAPDTPFRFVGGDPSVDFVNTVDWTSRGPERDRFTSYERVLEWARGARLIDAAEARRLAQVASKHPRRAAATLDAARDLRRVLHDVLSSVVTRRPSVPALAQLNASLSEAASHVRVVRGPGGRLIQGWAGLGDSSESLLWPVVWSAANLLASNDAERLRVCAGHDCGWVYVDRSRNGLRRWCEMSVCGTAEKNRRRASRA